MNAHPLPIPSPYTSANGVPYASQRSVPRERVTCLLSTEWADILREQAHHHGVTVQLYLAELVVDWIRRNGLEK